MVGIVGAVHHFNTSHVNVNPFFCILFYHFSEISIHLMLMLIGIREDVIYNWGKFQYISC